VILRLNQIAVLEVSEHFFVLVKTAIVEQFSFMDRVEDVNNINLLHEFTLCLLMHFDTALDYLYSIFNFVFAAASEQSHKRCHRTEHFGHKEPLENILVSEFCS